MSDDWPLPVDIRWLESFAVVAQERHFTRAAQRLSLSQPALSQHIARLERQIGVRLFDRSPGSVTLTPAGDALWAEVETAMAGLRAGIAAAHAVRDGSPSVLRVQHLSSYGPHVLPTVAARLRDTDPLLVLELREAGIEEQIEAIRRRAGDVGVFHLDPDVELDPTGITTAELAAAPRFLALPLSHPVATSGAVSLGDLSGEAWVLPVGSSEHSIQTQNAIAACRRHGFEPRVSQRANSIETMLGLVASGFGVAPAPWSIALRPPPSVRLVRLVDAPMRVVVAHRSGDPASTIERFVQAATDVVRSLLVDLEQRHPLR